MAKYIHAPTPHHIMARAAAPMDMVHMDTVGPYPESLGGSWYGVMFVDSASPPLQRPYGIRGKSAFIILGVVKRVVANIGVPRAVRTDIGAEYTNSTFVEYCNCLGIHRELTAPHPGHSPRY